jgi:hypothetical protein
MFEEVTLSSVCGVKNILETFVCIPKSTPFQSYFLVLRPITLWNSCLACRELFYLRGAVPRFQYQFQVKVEWTPLTARICWSGCLARTIVLYTHVVLQ